MIRFILGVVLAIELLSVKAVASLSCGEYLNTSENVTFDLSTKDAFNASLNKIRNSKDLSRFIALLKESLRSYSKQDKHSFVRSGVSRLQDVSVPYLGQINNYTRQSLLRISVELKMVNISVAFYSELERVTQGSISAMSSKDLSSYIHLVAKMNIKPSSGFLAVFEQEFINKADSFNPQSLSMTVYSLAVMGHVPSEGFFLKWQQRYSEFKEEFLTLNIANSLFAFYLFRNVEMLKWFVSETPMTIWPEIQSLSERRMIASVYEYYEKVLNIKLEPLISFSGQFRELVEPPKSGTSDLEKVFGMGLFLDGIDYVQEYQTTPGFYVDFYLPEQNLVIQVDGALHFIREIVDGRWVERLRPQDLLIDELLISYGYEVKRYSYRDIQVN